MGSCCSVLSKRRPSYNRLATDDDEDGDQELRAVQPLPTSAGERRGSLDSDDDWLENASPLTETQISLLTRTVGLDSQPEAGRGAVTEADAALEREALAASRLHLQRPPAAAVAVRRAVPLQFDGDFDLSKLDANSANESFGEFQRETPASVEDDFEAFLSMAKANMVAREAKP
eukprot:c3246_g1_i1.p1 GENE.c3246_g1_i1~~c3246_g1_i1.p1  ORF type:complete len:174 (-),score=34.64 c3246_g1_i1:289-810(-)